MPPQANNFRFDTSFPKIVSAPEISKWSTQKSDVKSVSELQRRHYERITNVNELIIENIRCYLIHQTNFFLKKLDETSQLVSSNSEPPQASKRMDLKSKALKKMTDEYVTNIWDGIATVGQCYSGVMAQFINCLTEDTK